MVAGETQRADWWTVVALAAEDQEPDEGAGPAGERAAETAGSPPREAAAAPNKHAAGCQAKPELVHKEICEEEAAQRAT